MHMQLDWPAVLFSSEDGAVAVAVWSVSEALVRCWSHRLALHAGTGLQAASSHQEQRLGGALETNSP